MQKGVKNEPLIKKCRYGCPFCGTAQVILRWHLQAGYITIPGSQNPDHILENYSVFDFELTDDDMQQMAELHTDKRYENR